MYIKGLLMMVIFLQTGASAGKVEYELVCENEKMELSCPSGYTIDVLAAFFGKKNYKYCYEPGKEIDDCEAKNTLDIVKSKCNLRQYCQLSALNDLFGDPCVGYLKYLEVSYRCLRNNNIKSLLACQHSELTIECPKDSTLLLVNVFYGRKKALVCPRDISIYKSLKCHSKTAFDIMTKCDFLNKCSFYADNEVLGGDPCPGSFKYLEVDYLCQKSLFYDVACEEETLILKCEKGYINIVTAFWGNKNRNYCNQPGKDVHTCEATGTLNITKFICDFRRQCRIEVDSNVFGDPCEKGTMKYLELTYDCVDDFSRRAIPSVACEHDQLQISCAEGQFLWIADAFFGRTQQALCYKAHEQVMNNVCSAEKALEIVVSRCENENQCSVNASVEIFGDPCCFTYKYLQVDYQCKSEKRILKT